MFIGARVSSPMTCIALTSTSWYNIHMVSVRSATTEDIPYLASECRRFADTLDFKYDYSPSDEALPGLLAYWMNHVLIVAELDGNIAGMFGGEYCCHPWNPEMTVLVEHFWWVDPEARSKGVGKALLEEFISRGSHCHAIKVHLENTSGVPDSFMERFGLRLKERTFIKEN